MSEDQARDGLVEVLWDALQGEGVGLIGTSLRNVVDAILAYPDKVLAALGLTEEHIHYTSTACQHARHSKCRKHCKFCPATCRCDCHASVQPVEPEEAT